VSSGDAYSKAGVDIDAQDRALDRVKEHVRSTYTSGVLSELGSFGGLFRPDFGAASEPVLVSSADGVGTKLRVAAMAGDYSTVGRDLVNHCINDILVQGARPLFFLDYVGAGRLEPATMEEIVEGIAGACRENGCALLGGETAEMPGFYSEGDYEVVGFILGWVDKPKLIDGSAIRDGDLLIGLPSSGLHTNGYSLARHVFFEKLGLSVGDPMPGAEDRRSVGEVLLAPHLSYLPVLGDLLEHEALHGLAHITGGGLTDNLPRILPDGFHAEIRMGSWDIPELFRLLQEHGEVDTSEMFRVFNMGIGMVLVIDAASSGEIFKALNEHGQRALPIGFVGKGGEGVVYNFGVSDDSDAEATSE